MDVRRGGGGGGRVVTAWVARPSVGQSVSPSLLDDSRLLDPRVRGRERDRVLACKGIQDAGSVSAGSRIRPDRRELPYLLPPLLCNPHRTEEEGEEEREREREVLLLKKPKKKKRSLGRRGPREQEKREEVLSRVVAPGFRGTSYIANHQVPDPGEGVEGIGQEIWAKEGLTSSSSACRAPPSLPRPIVASDAAAAAAVLDGPHPAAAACVLPSLLTPRAT
ncbi:hypothetical protein F4780DRAFT_406376 [Xylariomycetidae sp. FL0641]|nr:hypothetical protein F4780DRAFT_406376 [Xylariomycetidae sp. FL0641]